MKKTIYYSTFIIALTVMIFSCKKEEPIQLSTDETAEIAASALNSENGGITTQIYDATQLAEQLYAEETLKSSVDNDMTYIVSSPDGARISYNYSFHYNYGMTYNTAIQAFLFYMNFDTDGSYISSRISSNDNSDGRFELTGVEAVNEFYTVSGSATNTGTKTTYLKEDKTVNSTIKFNFSDVKINKSTQKIVEGTASVQINGNLNGGESFTFSGSIEYQSNGTIILIISGEQFIIDVATGEIQ